MSDYGRCNNCWMVIKTPKQDGSCPRCGCHVQHAYARRVTTYHGAQSVCHYVRCPRRLKDAKRDIDSKAR